jgi:tetraacyldisaccharide 4'-kinase
MNLTVIHDAREMMEKADAGGAIWAPVRLFLLLCSWAYGLVVRLRRFLYLRVPGLRKRVAAHVVSVGNITVGGSGKTPLVEMYARSWLQKGKKVAIVSRGYGKSEQSLPQSNLPEAIRAPGGVRVVSDGSGQIFLGGEEAGDEPYLLAKRVPDAPVIVSKDRFAACAFAVKQFGAEVMVLDDAFQHLRLHRDEDIVAVDATNPFGNGHLLPRGTLREPPTSLRRASRILLTKILSEEVGDGADAPVSSAKLADLEARLQGLSPEAEIARTHYVPTHLSAFPGGEMTPLAYLKGKKVVAFCGLADPGFFERTLGSVGGSVVKSRRFPDHYRYTPADLATIDEYAADCDADAIVTTEKDVARLPHDISTRCPIYAVAVEMRIVGDNRSEEEK